MNWLRVGEFKLADGRVVRRFYGRIMLGVYRMRLRKAWRILRRESLWSLSHDNTSADKDGS